MNVCLPFKGSFHITLHFKEKFSLNASQSYINNRYHEGLDFVAEDGIGTPVISICNGIVRSTGIIGNSQSYGNTVWVVNNEGSTTYGILYAHLNSISVVPGQTIRMGQKIGTEGNTGNVSGAHLHLEVHTSDKFKYNKDLIDPNILFNLPGNVIYNGRSYSGGTIEYPTNETIEYTSNSYSSQIAGNVQSNENQGYIDAITSQEFNYVSDIKTYYGMTMFGRKYQIKIINNSGSSIDISNLDVDFEVNKVSYDEPTASVIKIYNLSVNSENNIIKNAYKVSISAGYITSGLFGKIFEGYVVQPIRGKENGTDYYLKLICIDSSRYYQYGTVNNTFIAMQTQRDVASYCINNTIDTTAKATQGNLYIGEIQYPRGKVLFGSALGYLDTIAKTNLSSIYFNNGEVNMMNFYTLPNGEIIYISPSSGMIDAPTQTTITGGGIGVSCKCLLNPLLDINSMIHIDNSRTIAMEYDYSSDSSGYRPLDDSGIYRVTELTHKGSTKGIDWQTEVKAVSQLGALSGLMENPSNTLM